MQKHSKILEQLQKNSQEQNESIQQLHKNNLTSLNKSLIDLYSIKLSQIERDFRSSNESILENIESELYALNKRKILKYIVIASISLLLGSATTWYMMKDRTTEKNNDLIVAENTLELENKSLQEQIDQLQATRTANKELIQELQAWSIPKSMRRTDKEGKYIRVEETKVYNEEGTNYKWVSIKEK